MVHHVLVAVGDHGAPAVPASLADDVNRGREERVGVAHHRPDVQVVLPVLDGDVERHPAQVEVGDDRVHRPVAVAIDDVAAVSVGQQRRVEPRIGRPGLGMWADTDRLAEAVAERPVESAVERAHQAPRPRASRSIRPKTNRAMPMKPLVVKNARLTFDRSSGLTRLCS